MDSPVVIITGASSGIGEAAARACAAAGMRVVLAARNETRMREIAGEIAAAGGCALPCPTDIRDRAQIDALVAATLQEFGRLDALIANAGLGSPDGIGNIDDTHLSAIVETNVLGAMRCINAAVPAMRAQRHGHIVVIGSVTSDLPWPNDSVYAATKAAMRHLARRARSELRQDGITVSEIVPGVINTPLAAGVTGFPKPAPSVVGEAVVRCIRHPVPTLVIPGWYRWLILAHRIAPNIVEHWIAGRSRIVEE